MSTQGQPAGQPSEPYFMASGHWKEELVSIHGPNGHIASGLTTDQASPIVAELNRLMSLQETFKN